MENARYNKMLSSTVTTELSTTFAPKKNWTTEIENNGFSTTEYSEYKKGNITLEIQDINLIKYGLLPSTQKLLDCLILEFGNINNYKDKDDLNLEVQIDLNDYIELLGRKTTVASKDHIRAEVQNDLEFLYWLNIKWTGSDSKRRNFQDTRLLYSKGIHNGVINAAFTPAFAKYINSQQVIEYPMELLKISTRSPLNYYLGRKLATHYSMTANKKCGRNNIIKVETLLDAVQGILPSYDTVKEKYNGDTKNKIILPFEKALNTLQEEGIITWKYSNPKGEELSDGQMNSNKYSDFIKKMILFEFLEHPSDIINN